MTDILIRKVIQSDAEQLFALRLESLKTNPEAFGSSYEENSTRWTAKTYGESRIPDETANDAIFVADKQGQLVGMMGFIRHTRAKTKHTADIWGVYVSSSVRGQGIGKKLLQAILDHAHTLDGLHHIMLTVITENQAAIRLYETMGFSVYGTIPDALRDAQRSYDELLMGYQF